MNYVNANKDKDPGYWCAVTGVILFSVALAIKPVICFDVFYYLEAGRSFFDNNYSFIENDPYLFTLKNAYQHVSHEWGSILLTRLLYQAGGLTLLLIVKIALVAASVSVPFVLAYKFRYRSFAVPLVSALATYAFSYRFFLRTDLITTMFLLCILGIVLFLRHTGYQYKKVYLLLPALFLAWVNLHPGFLLGLFVWGLALGVDAFRYSVGENKDRKDGFLKCVYLYVLSVAMCFVNPDFVEGFLFPIKLALANEAEVMRTFIPEWQPSIAHFNMHHVKIFLVMSASCLAAIIYSLCKASTKEKRVDVIYEILLFGFFSYFGLAATRYIGISSMAFTMLLICLLQKNNLLVAKEKWGRIAKFSYVTIILGACIVFGFKVQLLTREISVNGWHSYLNSEVPHKLATHIEKTGIDTSRMYNHIRFGSYFVWRWSDTKKIFIHSFITDADFFEKDYIAAQLSEEGFDRVVEKYNLQSIILPPHIIQWFPIGKILKTKEEWQLDYEDPLAVVYIRRR